MNNDAYQSLLRELVREYGAAHRVRLDDAALASVLAYHDHILTETADEQAAAIRAALRGSSEWLGIYSSPQEAVGFLLCAAMRDRAIRAIRTGLECTEADLAEEEAEDREYERGVA
jgi:hypothetical protein